MFARGGIDMKLLAIFVVTILFLSSTSFLNAEEVDLTDQTIPAQSQLCEDLHNSDVTDEKLARRGCCSHHKGVCGCSGGRQQCCDGTLSPSCTCNKSDPNGTSLSVSL